jgi:[protein-PII] uridylyltransferase
MTPEINDSFSELVMQARGNAEEFANVPRQHCIAVTRAFAEKAWTDIRARHRAGESGSNVLRRLTETADTVMRGITTFGLYHTEGRWKLMNRVAICALGGYGRSELSPKSDLDVCLLYSGRLTRDIRKLNEYLVPFMWDLGFKAGYTIHSVREAAKLARTDPEVYTAYTQARLISGDNDVFARLKLMLLELQPRDLPEIMRHIRKREDPEKLPVPYRDLYAVEPDIKENAGGLRDYHAAWWIILLQFGEISLDDLARMGHMASEEHLDLIEKLDFLWRIRNELHFHTGKADNLLSSSLQKHVAQAFDYGKDTQQAMERFMQDYYNAARRMRWFLHTALRISGEKLEAPPREEGGSRSRYFVHQEQLCSSTVDSKWFAENPVRLMELIWQCMRRNAPLSYPAQCWVRENISLAGPAFRASGVVRRYFVALCSRLDRAGMALRQAAETGLLAAYIPEFAAIQGIVRYEDFHSYPVDEHTLRAIESLSAIYDMEGSLASVLQKNLEHIRDPHILVLAILFHDLGKASGDVHTAESVARTRTVCERIGLPEDESERIVFLVERHMLMANIALYRDTDDVDIVNQFAETMKTPERLRELLLLTYADLSAVGPAVWNEWKGALLVKLFLKAERILLGRGRIGEEEEYWKQQKAKEVRELVKADLRDEVEHYLKGLGERYFIAFSPKHIARHMACLEEARAESAASGGAGFAMRCQSHEATGMSEVVICTQDRHGLFAEITGCFTALLIDVHSATPFTTPDGYIVDCFTVRDITAGGRSGMARGSGPGGGRPLTKNQLREVERLLREVLIEGRNVAKLVDQSRRRLFALLQPRVPVRTSIEFDNESSASDTVIDIETGDRTGLLYDIAHALSDLGVDITSARIMTDARRVRDSFYVRMNQGKLEDESIQAAVRAGLETAIRPLIPAETKGDSS